MGCITKLQANLTLKGVIFETEQTVAKTDDAQNPLEKHSSHI